jgi:type IV secretion system protein VirB4
VLGVYDGPQGRCSEPLEFLSCLYNGEMRPVLAPQGDAGEYLPYRRVSFGLETLEMSRAGALTRGFGAMVSIKDYPAQTNAGMLDDLLRLPCEMVVTQSFGFVDRQPTLERMNLALRRMRAADDDGVSLRADLTRAKDDVVSGRAAFGEHHLTCWCAARPWTGLDRSTAEVLSAFTEMGAIAVREDINLEPAFWAQFPGNFKDIARRDDLDGQFRRLRQRPQLPGRPGREQPLGSGGDAAGDHLGRPLPLQLPQGRPGQLHDHRPVRIGQDRGAELPAGPGPQIRRASCSSTRIAAPRSSCAPSAVATRPAPRPADRLQPAGPARHGGQPPLPDRLDRASGLGSGRAPRADDQAGSRTPSTPISTRRRACAACGSSPNCSRALAVPTPPTWPRAWRPWHGAGEHAWLFDNADDQLDLDQATLGFDMTQLLDDPALRTPAMMYLFHRVEQRLDGHPTLIVIDEGWKALDDDVFVARIKDWEKTLRKRNGVVGFATQSAQDALESRIASAIIEQAATQIFMANPKAQAKDYCDGFGLTQHEFELVKSLPDTARCFLIKHGTDSVVARLNLAGAPELLTVLSGREKTVRQLDALREELGDAPEAWMAKLLRKAA